eukprot:3221425-Ditylum_brightwellii.AAC.1
MLHSPCNLLVRSWIMFCQAEYVKVSQEAMESGAHLLAAAPGLNPGKSVHLSGGEKKVTSRQALWSLAGGYLCRSWWSG